MHSQNALWSLSNGCRDPALHLSHWRETCTSHAGPEPGTRHRWSRIDLNRYTRPLLLAPGLTFPTVPGYRGLLFLSLSPFLSPTPQEQVAGLGTQGTSLSIQGRLSLGDHVKLLLIDAQVPGLTAGRWVYFTPFLEHQH